MGDTSRNVAIVGAIAVGGYFIYKQMRHSKQQTHTEAPYYAAHRPNDGQGRWATPPNRANGFALPPGAPIAPQVGRRDTGLKLSIEAKKGGMSWQERQKDGFIAAYAR